jgi:hypothetical protein
MGKKYQRQNGESMPAFRARVAAAEAASKPASPPRRRRHRHPDSSPSWQRYADRIDGYDRDDMGESPDY